MFQDNADLQLILDADDAYLADPFDDDFADEDWVEISAARRRAMLPQWAVDELESDLEELD